MSHFDLTSFIRIIVRCHNCRDNRRIGRWVRRCGDCRSDRCRSLFGSIDQPIASQHRFLVRRPAADQFSQHLVRFRGFADLVLHDCGLQHQISRTVVRGEATRCFGQQIGGVGQSIGAGQHGRSEFRHLQSGLRIRGFPKLGFQQTGRCGGVAFSHQHARFGDHQVTAG